MLGTFTSFNRWNAVSTTIVQDLRFKLEGLVLGEGFSLRDESYLCLQRELGVFLEKSGRYVPAYAKLR